MTIAEVLAHALALPPEDRATLAQSLLHSLPEGPAFYRSERELGTELQRRQEAIAGGGVPSYDAAETIRRARDAVAKVRT
jgi:putative addiction module component (TIGR02574 family)